MSRKCCPSEDCTLWKASSDPLRGSSVKMGLTPTVTSLLGHREDSVRDQALQQSAQCLASGKHSRKLEATPIIIIIVFLRLYPDSLEAWCHGCHLAVQGGGLREKGHPSPIP